MHDPMTQAFSIRYPWFRRVSWGTGRYHDEFITVWHVDPERDGSDDSCDWSGHRGLTAIERDWLRKEGEQEHQYFFRGILKYDDKPDGAMVQNTRGERWEGGMVDASGFEVLYGIASIILWRMPRGGGKPLCHRFLSGWRHDRELAAALPVVLGLASNSHDNVFHILREARARDDAGQKAMGELFVCIGRNLRRESRPWWRHPRWHIHHWSIRLYPWQNLRNWLTRKCHVCGKRFRWGEAPLYDSRGYSHMSHSCAMKEVARGHE